MHRAATAAVMLTVLAACGAQPTKPAQTAVGGSPATQSEGAADAVGNKVPSGYRRVKRNGQELYCRSVVTLGSRFAEEMCFTRKQIDEIATRTDSAMDDMERGRKVCVGIEGCGLN